MLYKAPEGRQSSQNRKDFLHTLTVEPHPQQIKLSLQTSPTIPHGRKLGAPSTDQAKILLVTEKELKDEDLGCKVRDFNASETF